MAPAKDPECAIAAIEHGADAVYVGAPRFGARAAVGNSLRDIDKIIQYAHRYWAKVYVALNTILFDDELKEAESLIHSLYEIGSDAIIIQDMGILEFDLPPIPLFASTQVHNYELDRIKFLEKVGIQRVILARELSLDQINEIRKNTSIDLECFIHGALCVSFSGRCYLSQTTQARSANRGVCAQPCRLPYTLIDNSGKILARDKYLLSLKDLNLSEYLKDLIDSGVTSFKIEGRLKDINYVKNVTAFYRKRIDEILITDKSLNRSSSGQTTVTFKPDLSRTFNRGFTEYFIDGRRKDILSPHTPKSVGACLGKVEKVLHDHFTLTTDEVLYPGDGICFFNNEEVLCGTNINKVDGNKIYPSELKGLTKGTVIYRNYDYKFAKTLQNGKTRRLINIQMEFNETREGFNLSLEDEDGIKILVSEKIEKIPAKKRSEAEETIRRQLMKLGETIYAAETIVINWSKPYFIPISWCNKIRREAVEKLNSERAFRYVRQISKISPNNIPYPIENLDFSFNVANRKSELFYKRHGVKTIQPAFELLPDKKSAIMTMKHCLRFQYGLCRGRSTHGLEPLFLEDARNRFQLDFDCISCQMQISLVGKKK